MRGRVVQQLGLTVYPQDLPWRGGGKVNPFKVDWLWVSWKTTALGVRYKGVVPVVKWSVALGILYPLQRRRKLDRD